MALKAPPSWGWALGQGVLGSLGLRDQGGLKHLSALKCDRKGSNIGA